MKKLAGGEEVVSIKLWDAFWVWAKVALLSFGGPAGQIAVMHRLLVDEKKWITEARFLHALNYCMLLPGPEAQQLAIYIGWLKNKWVGGVMAGVLFVLPGFVSILVLSIVYALYRQLDFVNALFFGLKPAVLSIVIAAVIRIGSKALKTPIAFTIAALSFLALFFFGLSFPLVIITAAVIGFLGGEVQPAAAVSSDSETEVVIEPSFSRALRILFMFSVLWGVPLLGLFLWLGPENVFTQEAIFFSKAAVLTFGGAYAVLGYIAQQAVQNYGWLMPTEMLDGLGMAETTPGPLIQVVQFVGFMGAFRAAEAGLVGVSPLAAGILGSIVTTWMTFVPCFLWIFLGAPYIEKLRNNQGLSRALSAITAAVVGVILNLAVWFFLHVVFRKVDETQIGILKLHIPDFGSIDIKTFGLAALAAVLSFGFGISILKLIATMVVVGFGVYFI